MKNNQTTLLALLIWAGSTLAMAAEPHHDAHDKPADPQSKAAEKSTEKAPEKAAEKAVEKVDEHAKAPAKGDEHAAAAKVEVPLLADAPAKPVGQKKKVQKKVRVAQKPADAVKADHVAAAHEKPAGVVAADPHHAAPDAAQAHADAHGDSHSNAAASPPAAVSDNSVRPRNRVSTAPANKDVHADVLAAPHADSQAAAPAAAIESKPDTHAATIAPAKTAPLLEAVPAVSENVKEDACSPPLKADIAALFERWNASLKTGDAKKVVSNYATPSILLPTVSNQARFTAAEKEDYFVHFLQRKPEGSINDRMIEVDCHSATDAGLYSFKFADGSVVKARYSFSYKKVGDEWLISSHHSSAMPEKTEVADTHGSHPAPSIALDRNDAALKNGGWIRFP